MLAIETVRMVQCHVLWQHWKRYYREDKLGELIRIFPVWNIFFVFQERLQHLFGALSAASVSSFDSTQSIVSHSTSTVLALSLTTTSSIISFLFMKNLHNYFRL